ncbi:hypothetical protein [Pseudonocardia kunmingensis]|uniref:Uncharacterized protein n=1 Tax=Pseudonocardia kunmingensis TaxID=630975 RepID=A0A543D4C0_9PSEU|nr:hypothetical protein [Pseudonocardia kunmingensis]TQM04176.1 hypothetical protein FB558_7207 [Pseudonocardia kunmingensis]
MLPAPRHPLAPEAVPDRPPLATLLTGLLRSAGAQAVRAVRGSGAVLAEVGLADGDDVTALLALARSAAAMGRGRGEWLEDLVVTLGATVHVLRECEGAVLHVRLDPARGDIATVRRGLADAEVRRAVAAAVDEEGEDAPDAGAPPTGVPARPAALPRFTTTPPADPASPVRQEGHLRGGDGREAGSADLRDGGSSGAQAPVAPQEGRRRAAAERGGGLADTGPQPRLPGGSLPSPGPVPPGGSGASDAAGPDFATAGPAASDPAGGRAAAPRPPAPRPRAVGASHTRADRVPDAPAGGPPAARPPAPADLRAPAEPPGAAVASGVRDTGRGSAWSDRPAGPPDPGGPALDAQSTVPSMRPVPLGGRPAPVPGEAPAPHRTPVPRQAPDPHRAAVPRQAPSPRSSAEAGGPQPDPSGGHPLARPPAPALPRPRPTGGSGGQEPALVAVDGGSPVTRSGALAVLALPPVGALPRRRPAPVTTPPRPVFTPAVLRQAWVADLTTMRRVLAGLHRLG